MGEVGVDVKAGRDWTLLQLPLVLVSWGAGTCTGTPPHPRGTGTGTAPHPRGTSTSTGTPPGIRAPCIKRPLVVEFVMTGHRCFNRFPIIL